MIQYGVIDIGSNTIRAVVYQTQGTSFRPILMQRYMVGLAGYVNDGRLTQEGILKACQTLEQCHHLLDTFDLADTFAFATASLRNISNTREAVDQIFFATGYAVEVLSGQTEAYLDYYGVLTETPLDQCLLFDIGGGSTELVTVAHDGPGMVESLPIGSLMLARTYVKKIFPKTKEREQICARIQKELKARKFHRLPTHTSICGVGGTARAVLRLVQVQQGLPEEQQTITTAQYLQLKKTLWKKDSTARALLMQNCPDRLHTIYPGLLIIDALVQLTQCETIFVSRCGVREGYLKRALMRQQKQPKQEA